MGTTNRRGMSNQSRMAKVLMMAGLFGGLGGSNKPQLGSVTSKTNIAYTNPIFAPKEHTKMTYRGQQRMATKRKNQRRQKQIMKRKRR